MRLQVYAVFDKAVSAFASPLVFRSKGEAVRSFADACVTEGTQFKKHAKDYAFFEIGVYDDNAGVFENMLGGPQLVLSGFEAERYLSEDQE